MKKLLLAVPLAGALLLGPLAALAPRGATPPARAPKAEAPGPPSRPRAKRAESPPPVPLREAPLPMTPPEQGRALESAAFRTQVAAYTGAALSGDENTRKAMLQSLARAPAPARAAVEGRLAASPSPREKEILDELMRSLR